jgi:hypothetical protein
MGDVRGNDAKRSLSLKLVKLFVLRSVYEKGSAILGFGNRKYLHLMINTTPIYTEYLKIHEVAMARTLPRCSVDLHGREGADRDVMCSCFRS